MYPGVVAVRPGSEHVAAGPSRRVSAVAVPNIAAVHVYTVRDDVCRGGHPDATAYDDPQVNFLTSSEHSRCLHSPGNICLV